jgi:hypothetical protein
MQESPTDPPHAVQAMAKPTLRHRASPAGDQSISVAIIKKLQASGHPLEVCLRPSESRKTKSSGFCEVFAAPKNKTTHPTSPVIGRFRVRSKE